MSKFNLTKQEALKALKEGHKVTREYFTKDEYIFINEEGILMSEDGFEFNEWWDMIEPKIERTTEKAWAIFDE